MTPRVPLELISLIIDHLASDDHPGATKALKSCTLAAQLFIPLCQPYLFYAISNHEPYLGLYKYKDWTDILTQKPTICNYVREITICLLDSHRDAGAYDMEARFPGVLEMLPGVHSVALIPRTWNVGSKMGVALRELFARPTLHTLRIENSSFMSPGLLSRITHVKHLSFDHVGREVLVFNSFGADPLLNASRVRLESLSVTSCGSIVTTFLNRTVTSWDFSRLKYLKLGLNEDYLTSPAVYAAWNFVQKVAEAIEELTIVIYSYKSIYTQFDLSVFPNLKSLTLDMKFIWKEPGKDLLSRTIIPLLYPRSPSPRVALQRIRILSPMLTVGSPMSSFTKNDWIILNTALSDMEIYPSLQLLEVGFRRVVSEAMRIVQTELITKAMLGVSCATRA